MSSSNNESVSATPPVRGRTHTHTTLALASSSRLPQLYADALESVFAFLANLATMLAMWKG